MNTIILQNGKTAIMNMEKMKEKKEPLRNSYESDLLTIFFRIGLDFFSDSAIIRIQNPYIQAAARWRGREVCEKMKNKSRIYSFRKQIL